MIVQDAEVCSSQGYDTKLLTIPTKNPTFVFCRQKLSRTSRWDLDVPGLEEFNHKPSEDQAISTTSSAPQFSFWLWRTDFTIALTEIQLIMKKVLYWISWFGRACLDVCVLYTGVQVLDFIYSPRDETILENDLWVILNYTNFQYFWWWKSFNLYLFEHSYYFFLSQNKLPSTCENVNS